MKQYDFIKKYRKTCSSFYLIVIIMQLNIMIQYHTNEMFLMFQDD